MTEYTYDRRKASDDDDDDYESPEEKDWWDKSLTGQQKQRHEDLKKWLTRTKVPGSKAYGWPSEVGDIDEKTYEDHPYRKIEVGFQSSLGTDPGGSEGDYLNVTRDEAKVSGTRAGWSGTTLDLSGGIDKVQAYIKGILKPATAIYKVATILKGLDPRSRFDPLEQADDWYNNREDSVKLVARFTDDEAKAAKALKALKRIKR